jgi:two-component system, NtrC family, sensor kinase
MTKSIVGKLTLFVGVLVGLNTALLIGAAYVTISAILRDQIQSRLEAIAGDRQEILFHEFQQQQGRVLEFAGRPRIQTLFSAYADGTLPPDRFVEQAGGFLANVQVHAAGLLALWVEDDSGGMLASSGQEALVTALARSERLAVDPATGGGLAVPPRQIADTYAAVFAGAVRDDNGRLLGTVLLAVDLGRVMTFLGDTRSLGEHGEVLVGWKSGDRIHIPWPPRGNPALSEVSAEAFPSLNAASSGSYGFTRTTDYRDRDVLVAYRPLGNGYPNWGLIAKFDTAEAYEPVAKLRRLLLAMGGGLLVLGLAASNAIARQFARPIKRLARTSAAVAAGDLTVRSEVTSSDEIGGLSLAFNRMTEELQRSYADLELRIVERTRALEAVRDLLDGFFEIWTSRLDPINIDKTFDTVLRSCAELDYDLAMISLVDHEAGVVRAVRASGSMAGVLALTVRPLDGGDVLAIAAREGRAIVVADAMTDPRCDAVAAAAASVRGLVVLPMISDEVLGTLQVGTLSVLDPDRLDLRPLEALASHTARALTGLRQLEEIRRLNQSLQEHAQELARSELALREQTRILQSVLDCMGDGVIVADASSRFLVFNPAARRITGHDRIDAPPAEWSRRHEIYLPDRVTPYPPMELPLIRAIRGESVDQVELYVAYPSQENGTWILVTGRPLKDERGTIEGGVVVFHDITRRKQSERRLAAQYETTRVLAEAESLGQVGPRILETIGTSLDWDFGALWRVDLRANRLRCAAIWSRPGLDLSRFEAMTWEIEPERGARLPGRVWADGAPEWVPDIASDPQSLRRPVAEACGVHAGFAVPIELQGECLGVLEFFSREVRPVDHATLDMMASLGSQIGQFLERQQMRTRVAQSEKLASLGMLSAGVAHEINNPLAYIANNLAVLDRDSRFLLDVLDLYEQGRPELTARPELLHRIDDLADTFDLAYVKENLGQLLDSTRRGVKRVADIVQNLRGFARLDRAEDHQADVHEAVRTALEMVRGRLVRRNIAVEEHFAEIPSVAGSPAQLNQVFLNLLVNALQAIEETHRADGRIAITTGAVDGEVIVEVADNGCGIPDEVLPHIFDPFFTTKGVGDGTGLGLSITHGMVHDNGGRLEVDSTFGQGTRFRVILAASSTSGFPA